MDMCYDGALVMPSSYAMMEEEEMCYFSGGGTFCVKVGRNSFVISALSALGAGASKAAMTAVLDAIGISIATSIELGTAGMGTLVAGAFILTWGGIASTLASCAVSYGINSLKGKKFKIISGKYIPTRTFTI